MDLNSDLIKALENINEPDPRNSCFEMYDHEISDFRPININDHYNSISPYQLNNSVPEKVIVQFETVKNLYLYTWFVYRFYPVTELYAFTCLEFALRTRYEKEIPKEYYPRSKEPMLKSFLRYVVDNNFIKNENFKIWQESTKRKARYRYEQERMAEMDEKGLREIEIDYSKAEIKDIDKNWEYVEMLKESLPRLRNHYTHGSTTLHNQVLGTVQVVSEIINQIYE